MVVQLPEHIDPLRLAVRDFATRELRPRVDEMEEAGAIDRSLIDKIGQLGYFGAPFEERWGGSAMGEIGFTIVQEEIARAHASTAVLVAASSGLAARMIAVAGSDEQKKRFLTPMAQGKGVGAFCLTEAGAGSDVPAMATAALADGDNFVINGQKNFISNGQLAEYFVTFAKTDPAQRGRGISLFVIDAGTPGLEIVRLEDKMGIRASDTAEIVYDNVRIDRDRLIGDENTGLQHALSTLNQSRIGIAAISLGMAKEAVKLAWEYAHQRELFGGTLGDQQVAQHTLADMQISLYTAESITYRTALMSDAGENIESEASICKTFVTEAAEETIDRSLQMHGGIGYIRGSAIERIYRDHRVQRIYEGANEVQRNNIYRVMRRLYG